MDKLIAIRIKYDDQTYSEQIPVSVLAENVQWNQSITLKDILGNIDLNNKGNIQDQIDELKNSSQIKTIQQNLENQRSRAEAAQALKINKPTIDPNGANGQILQTDGWGGTIWVDKQTDEQIANAVTDWLDNHVVSGSSTIVIDDTLNIQGAAADAKKIGDELSVLKEDLTSIRTDAQDIKGNTQIEKAVSGSGCAVVLQETTSAPLTILLTGADANTTVTACGRNMYKLERNAYLMNGVAFTYDKTTGKIHIEGTATATTFSTPDEQLVNGTRYSCNAKWKFSQRTAVTLSPNFSQFLNYDSKIFMSVITADGVFSVINAGGTFIVDAGDEIAFRIQVRSGWSGSLDCYPQVEINTHPSAFERFNGYTSPNYDGANNIFQLPSRNKWVTRGITAVFDHDTNSLILSGTATADALIVDDSGTLDGSAWNHIFKFTPSVDTIVHFSGVSQKYKGRVFAQIGYNGSVYTDTGNGFTLNAMTSHEVGYRLLVKSGTTLDRFTVTPVISTGLCALQSQNGITTVYTNDGSTVNVSAQSNTSMQMLERTNNTFKNLNILTAFNILHPLSRIKGRAPVISFIDDDTSSKADVERYAAVFDAKGVVGNYAVMPYSIESRTSENLDTVLLNLEKRGYGMLYHCYHQNGSNSDSPGAFYLETYRNMVLAEDDFMTGWRKFLQYGFTNGNFWVAPYGVNDLQMQALAKRHGMRCLISMSNDRYISPSSGFNRWNIPRISVSPSSNVAHYQNTVDACVADGGWLVVCTHANSWGSGTDVDTKVANAIQYALDAGMVVKSFPEAFEDYMAVFDLYDLM